MFACVCIVCDGIYCFVLCVWVCERARNIEWWNAFFTLLKWNVKRKRWTHTHTQANNMKWWFCEGKVIEAHWCKQTIPQNIDDRYELLRECENLSEGFECVRMFVLNAHTQTFKVNIQFTYKHIRTEWDERTPYKTNEAPNVAQKQIVDLRIKITAV